MRQYRALLRGQGTSIVALYWAGCIINMSGFDLRQAQEALRPSFSRCRRGGDRHVYPTGLRRSVEARLPRGNGIRTDTTRLPNRRGRSDRSYDTL
jgi:hypothetical protein